MFAKTRGGRKRGGGERTAAESGAPLMRPKIEQTVARTRYFKASFTGEIDLIEGIARATSESDAISWRHDFTRVFVLSSSCSLLLFLSLPLYFLATLLRLAHEVEEKAVSRAVPPIKLPSAAEERSLLVDLLLYRIDRLDLCEKVPGIG